MPIQIGIFSRTFAGPAATVPEHAHAVLASCRMAGFDCVQFNFSSAGLPALPDSLGADIIEAIRSASARAGVPIVALSATANLIHPDPARRAWAVARVRVALEAAQALGIPMVTLCTGTRDQIDPWRAHPQNVLPEAWHDLRAALDALLPHAHGIVLGIEPESGNVVANAPDARRLLDEVADPALRIVFDPANLAGQSTRAMSARTVSDGIDLLASDIALVHAKDHDSDGMMTAPGRGTVDFAAMASRLHAAGYTGPIVAHGFGPEVAPEVAGFLRHAFSRP